MGRGLCLFQRSEHVYAIHIGHEHVEKDYAWVATLSSKKPSFAVAGNENSITQAQRYSGICLRNKLTVINNQNNIIAHKRHRSLLPLKHRTCKTESGTDRPQKVQEFGGTQTARG